MGSTATNVEPNSTTNTIKLQSISFCIINYNNNTPLVMNLFGFESEPQIISNDSIIKIQYSNNKNNTITDLFNTSSSFPIVPPLSTIKASQPTTDNEKEQNTKQNNNNTQAEMLKNVDKCNNTLDISIPFCFIDLTVDEIHSLIHLFSIVVLF